MDSAPTFPRANLMSTIAAPEYKGCGMSKGVNLEEDICSTRRC